MELLWGSFWELPQKASGRCSLHLLLFLPSVCLECRCCHLESEEQDPHLGMMSSELGRVHTPVCSRAIIPVLGCMLLDVCIRGKQNSCVNHCSWGEILLPTNLVLRGDYLFTTWTSILWKPLWASLFTMMFPNLWPQLFKPVEWPLELNRAGFESWFGCSLLCSVVTSLSLGVLICTMEITVTIS